MQRAPALPWVSRCMCDLSTRARDTHDEIWPKSRRVTLLAGPAFYFSQANHTLEDMKIAVLKGGQANQEYTARIRRYG